jgi:ferredoxin
MKKINKKDTTKLLHQWSREFAVFVPSREKGVAKLEKWAGKDANLWNWYRNTVEPPKANLLPPMEKMFRFQKEKTGYRLELSRDEYRQILFGIRPCDARAMPILDKTFNDSYKDQYYLSKRRNTVLVGLGCTRPYDSCFCTSLGISPAASADVDLMLTDIGDQLLVEEITEVGKELMSKTNGVEEATEANEAKAREVKETAIGKVTRRVETEYIERKLQSGFEDEDYWQGVAAKCLTCGICTFLCPTCHCFDINDELVKKQGARFRSWDSCAFCIYTRMPMENPREEKWKRVRQKVCHKYEFYPMNFGVIACTGCGRCIRQCPVNWDITRILASLPAKVSPRVEK